MSDRLAAYVRTYYPLALGHVAALIVAWVGARFGLTVDSLLVYEILAVGLTGLVYAVGAELGRVDGDGRWPRVARAVGRWLLSLGLDTGAPTYGLPPAKTETEYEVDEAGHPRVVRSVTTWPPRPSS